MKVPVDVGKEGLEVLVVVDPGFLGAGEGAELETAAGLQAEGVDQQEAVLARWLGHVRVSPCADRQWQHVPGSHARSKTTLEQADMADIRLGVIINGATGRMGTTQHMANL